MLDLNGKVALVTGAGRGMGLGMARALAQNGARVAINDLFPDRVEEACEQLQSEGLQAVPAAFDVTDYEAVAQAVAELGQIDILVTNAGIPGKEGMELQQFIDMEPASWSPMVELNLFGTLNCIHCVLPGMRERGWGRVMVVSSDAGRFGTNSGVTIYGSCKAAAVQLIRNLSQEVASMGITANAISLGPMDNLPEDIVDFVAKSVPLGRLGSPADAGAAIAFLASDEAAWITGVQLPVNGGMSPS